jgi:hypothetical protein
MDTVVPVRLPLHWPCAAVKRATHRIEAIEPLSDSVAVDQPLK